MADSFFKNQYGALIHKFQTYWIHRKKIKALENFSEVKYFPGSKYLKILKELIKDGFLEKEEEEFLDYQIKKTQCNFYIWSHKTKWVRDQLSQAKKVSKPSMQLILPLDGVKPLNVPIMPIIPSTSTTQTTLRV